MIVYEGLKTDFLMSCENDSIAIEIEENILNKMGRHTPKSEFHSWENSLNYMYKVLNDREIPSDAGVAIEYNIPQTSKRVDFIISGYNQSDESNMVIVELKQWEDMEEVQGTDALVETFTGGAKRRVVHPCACLHNYIRHENDPLDAKQYEDYLGNGEPFAVSETSINEVGCIHTSQGLEFDYVGVIIGDDIRFENGEIITDFTKRARTDQSLKGIKKLFKAQPEEAQKRAEEIIKNTYRTLMTRGMKGCYIYCTDPGMQMYLKKRLEGIQK